MVLVGAAAGTGVWLQQQRTVQREAKTQREAQARKDVAGALERVAPLRRNEQWREAQLVLTEAATHLADADAPELEEQLRRTRADIRFADELEQVRDSRPVRDGWNPDHQHRATKYQEAFARAGFDLGTDADLLVAAIRTSAVRDQIVAALDDLAFMAFELGDAPQVARVLLLARRVDPEPVWRDRFRDPNAWKSPERLRELAGAAVSAEPFPPGHQVGLLSVLLRHHRAGRTTELLREACRRQPGNFWLNREMGEALRADGRPQEAIGFYRAALAVRPEHPGILEDLGMVFQGLDRTDEALAALYRAAELAPAGHSAHGALVYALTQSGYWLEAEAAYQRAQRTDPTNRFPAFRLATALFYQHRDDEAIALYQKAAEIDRTVASTYTALGTAYSRMNRHEEAAGAYRTALKLLPANYTQYLQLASELTRAGKVEEAITALRTGIAEKPNHAWFHVDLGRLLRAQGRSEEALIAFRRAAELHPPHSPIWELIVATHLDRGEFAKARTAAEHLVTLYGSESERRERRRQLERCTALVPFESHLPAALAGAEQPYEALTQLALADWCLKHKRFPALAAEHYTLALAAGPPSVDDLEVGDRFRAACAAALAGCGVGPGAAALDGAKRFELRQRALAWLTADYTAWAKRHRQGKPGARQRAAAAVRAWQVCEDLALVRGAVALDALPSDESGAWRALWAQVGALAARDPVAKLVQGREHIERQEWGKAAACYAEALELEPTDNGEVWFEFAAAQLLAGDQAGYRRACTHMLERGRATSQMRAYLVARTWTLTPSAAADLEQPQRLAESELKRNGDAFWSLAEQGALRVRAGRFGEAVPLLERGLQAEIRPGRAVLNWLWLALAAQKSGRPDEARRWLGKATRWLDQQRGRMPRDTTHMGSDHHNWLEAQILRAEVERLLAQAK
jgi:tetratricopeptide (TPR) repeat protein